MNTINSKRNSREKRSSFDEVNCARNATKPSDLTVQPLISPAACSPPDHTGYPSHKSENLAAGEMSLFITSHNRYRPIATGINRYSCGQFFSFNSFL